MVRKGKFVTLGGQFHRAHLSSDKSLAENLIEAAMCSNFDDMPEYSLITFGEFCLLAPSDICIISSVVNPLAPDFTSAFLGVVPGLLLLISEIERSFSLGKSQILLDFNCWKPKGLLISESDRHQTLACLLLHGGYIAESESEVIINFKRVYSLKYFKFSFIEGISHKQLWNEENRALELNLAKFEENDLMEILATAAAIWRVSGNTDAVRSNPWRPEYLPARWIKAAECVSGESICEKLHFAKVLNEITDDHLFFNLKICSVFSCSHKNF